MLLYNKKVFEVMNLRQGAMDHDPMGFLDGSPFGAGMETEGPSMFEKEAAYSFYGTDFVPALFFVSVLRRRIIFWRKTK